MFIIIINKSNDIAIKTFTPTPILLLVVLSLAGPLRIAAQGTEFARTMSRKVGALDSASITEYADLAADFSRMASASDADWMAAYYAAFRSTNNKGGGLMGRKATDGSPSHLKQIPKIHALATFTHKILLYTPASYGGGKEKAFPWAGKALSYHAAAIVSRLCAALGREPDTPAP